MIKKILIDNWALQHKKKLGKLPSDLCIPIKKTSHQPAFAAQEKCLGNDGNIKVLKKLQEQLGLDEDILCQFVLLVHGNLGVVERIHSVLKSHKIEQMDIETLEYIKMVLGLFHILMACADAMWHIYLEPKGLHNHPCSVWKQFCQLYPNLHAKLGTHPGFCVMHDSVEHILAVQILDCA